MRLLVVAVGNRPPDWARAAFGEYARRMPPQYRLELVEVSPSRRAKHTVVSQILDEEIGRIRRVLPGDAHVVALDRKGRAPDSEGIALALGQWAQDGVDVAFVVGGPDGLPDSFLREARDVWSLSRLTFPHMLARVMLAEQLYRAWSITAHQPYHRSDRE